MGVSLGDVILMFFWIHIYRSCKCNIHIVGNANTLETLFSLTQVWWQDDDTCRNNCTRCDFDVSHTGCFFSLGLPLKS